MAPILAMLSDYIHAVMTQATYRVLPEDESIYGEILGYDDVHAQAETLETCRQNLAEAVEEWIFFRVSRKLPIPTVDGVSPPVKLFH
ncbi:MAG: type II toxin-antitoxin system HicB family antitoxin [Thermosynechococcaceae cyanobacterium]